MKEIDAINPYRKYVGVLLVKKNKINNPSLKRWKMCNKKKVEWFYFRSN